MNKMMSVRMMVVHSLAETGIAENRTDGADLQLNHGHGVSVILLRGQAQTIR